MDSGTTSLRSRSLHRADRAQSSIKLLCKCFLFLSTCLLVLTIGLRGSVTRLEQYRSEANADLDLQLGHITREQRATQKLETLNNVSFGKSYRDTHMGCLMRGVNIVEAHFKPHSYINYPYIRKEVMDWVQTTCDRHMFNLQAKQSTPDIVLLTRWARLRKETKDLVQLVKSKLARYATKLRGRWAPQSLQADKPTEREYPTMTHVQPSLQGPFKLVDCDKLYCRLVYDQSKSGSFTKVPDKETLEAAKRRVADLSWSKQYFKLAYDIVSFSATVLDISFVLGATVLTYYACVWHSHAIKWISHRGRPSRCPNFGPDVLSFGVVCRCCLAVASVYFPQIPQWVYMGFVAAALTALFTFCVPGVMFPDILDLRYAIEEAASLILDCRSQINGKESKRESKPGSEHDNKPEEVIKSSKTETERRHSGHTTLEQDLAGAHAEILENTVQSTESVHNDTSDCWSEEDDAIMEDVDLGSETSTGSDWSLLESN